MPSTYSLRFRLNLQAPGENLNTWGTNLNLAVFQLLEDAIARRVAFVLSGPKVLTSLNGATDEARCAFLDVTGGTGGAITAPALEKLYVVRNASTGDVSVTTGGGTSATFKPGEVGWAIGDGTNFRRAQLTDFGGVRITGVADPVGPQDAATKAYADNLAFTANAGILPGQGGNAGKFLTTDGVTASWRLPVADQVGANGKFLRSNGANGTDSWVQPATTDLSDITTYTAARTAFAIAMAIAL